MAATPAAASREPFTPSLPKTWKAAETEASPAKAAKPAGRSAAEAKKPSRDAKRRTARSGSTTTRTARGGGASCGHASWYASGSRTANGERFVPSGLTAAHRTMAFGTRLLVTDPATRKSVTVRINDRGPFIRGRMIDLSRGAAAQLGVVGRGVAHVCVSVLGTGKTATRSADAKAGKTGEGKTGGRKTRGGEARSGEVADAETTKAPATRRLAADAGERDGAGEAETVDTRLIAARSVAITR